MSVKDYQIVEFVDEQKNETFFFDCVPSKWVTYDQAQWSCVCKFMSPPYNTKSRIKLNKLMSNNAEAPESWLSYPVYLRGEGGKSDCYIFLTFKISVYKFNLLLYFSYLAFLISFMPFCCFIFVLYFF